MDDFGTPWREMHTRKLARVPYEEYQGPSDTGENEDDEDEEFRPGRASPPTPDDMYIPEKELKRSRRSRKMFGRRRRGVEEVYDDRDTYRLGLSERVCGICSTFRITVDD